MNPIRSLCWKEYREQQLVWFGLTGLAILLVVVLSAALAPAGMFSVRNDEILRSSVISIVLILTATYGVVCGAMLLAGEREAKTDSFLEALPASRSTLWRGKVLLGLVLVSVQFAVMFFLSVFFELPRQMDSLVGWFLFLLLMALECFAWSLCAAALCRSVLAACALSVPLLLASWSVVIVLAIPLAPLLVFFRLISVGAGLAISHQIYSAPDRLRRHHVPGMVGPQVSPAGWRVLLWLVWQQGKVPILVIAGCILVLGSFLPVYGLWLWPLATLAIGLVCGNEVFAQDQTSEGNRFLGNQRLPAGWLWTFKTGFWFAVAALATFGFLLVGYLAAIVRQISSPNLNQSEIRDFLGNIILSNLSYGYGESVLFGLWAIYGFALGMLCAQIMRKQVIGLLLALSLSVLVLALWLPSIVGGGLFAWQLLLPPVVLVLTSRLLMWPWLSGRMKALRPVMALVLCFLLVGAWMGGNLWYRTVEVPDIEVPFDVAAFEKSLPVDSETGSRIREALVAMQNYEKQTILKSLKEQDEKNGVKDTLGQENTSIEQINKETYSNRSKLQEFLQEGRIEEDKNIAQFLDNLFTGDWPERLKKAVEMPPGMLKDPRQYRWSPETNYAGFATNAGILLNARVRQWLERKQPAKALPHLLTTLHLSSQLGHKASNNAWDLVNATEYQNLRSVESFLSQAKEKPELLRPLLKALLRKDQEMPPATEMIKAEYLAWQNRMGPYSQNRSSSLENQLVFFLQQVPWEKERNQRITNAVLASEFYLASIPTWQLPPVKDLKQLPWEKWLIHFVGMDLPGSPASALSPTHWERIIAGQANKVWLGHRTLITLQQRAKDLHHLRQLQLQTALFLFQAEQRREAKELQELVPKYIPALPINPQTGQAYSLEMVKQKDQTPEE